MHILDKPAKTVQSGYSNGKDLRIGHDFARIGLPKTHFGAFSEILGHRYNKLLDSVSQKVGYYWINTS